MRLKLMAAGLLAVACAAPASALVIWPWGYIRPDGQAVQETDHFSASPETPYLNQTVTFTASPGKGLAVDCWLSQSTLPQGGFTGSKLSGSDGQNPFEWVCDQSTANTVWFAVQYRYIKYALAYDAAGGASVAGQSNLLYSDAFALAGAPSRTGFLFGGWRDGSGKVHAAGYSVTGESFAELDAVHSDGYTVTLTAQWTAAGYALTYDLAGGTAAAGYPAQAAFDEVFRLAAPTRTGYKFAGWKLSGAGSTARWGATDNPQTSVSAGTAVGGGADAVYFKNLTATDGGTVKLTATWQAKEITVEFNKEGGSGGTSGTRTYTYDSVPFPASVDPPSRSPDTFNGYWTEPNGQGRQLWTATGQWHDVNAVWDIPNDIVVYAAWTLSLTRTVKFDSGFSSVQSVDCTIGEPFGRFFPTITGTNATDVFLGWYSNATARVAASDPVPRGQYELLLTAHWDKETYCIAFDGSGATSGEMSVMTCKFDATVSLPANAFARTGYTFDHWRDASGTQTFADGQENLKNILNTGVRATNTLYAAWRANRYAIVLDPNGGEGAARVWQTVSYDDETVRLPTAAEVSFSREPFAFGGWSNTVTGVVYTDLSAPVGKLCAEDNGQIVLMAVWGLSDLAVAMDCTNLNWKNSPYAGKDGEAVWEVADGGRETATCARQSAVYGYPSTLTASVITNSGTLSFCWLPKGSDGKLLCWIDGLESPTYPMDKEAAARLHTGTDGVWSLVTTNLVVAPRERKYIHLANFDPESSIRVDLMTWTPEGANPEPTDADKVTISSAAVSDGKFTLSFEFNEDFDYLLKTNADLLIDSWGVMEIEGKKTDNILTFEPQIIEGQPQLFYKVETIQKK